ncbi:MAG: hypothetical protein KDC00_14350 [Flavobacteriales bacterium]|nr:hypothetical protein [Flavobacteriales bacterium]
MWPVQTLTLLLCLTDEEQLFAQSIPTLDGPAPTELVVPATVEEECGDALFEDFA